jgi:hypothetical protein
MKKPTTAAESLEGSAKPEHRLWVHRAAGFTGLQRPLFADAVPIFVLGIALPKGEDRVGQAQAISGPRMDAYQHHSVTTAFDITRLDFHVATPVRPTKQAGAEPTFALTDRRILMPASRCRCVF